MPKIDKLTRPDYSSYAPLKSELSEAEQKTEETRKKYLKFGSEFTRFERFVRFIKKFLPLTQEKWAHIGPIYINVKKLNKKLHVSSENIQDLQKELLQKLIAEDPAQAPLYSSLLQKSGYPFEEISKAVHNKMQTLDLLQVRPLLEKALCIDADFLSKTYGPEKIGEKIVKAFCAQKTQELKQLITDLDIINKLPKNSQKWLQQQYVEAIARPIAKELRNEKDSEFFKFLRTNDPQEGKVLEHLSVIFLEEMNRAQVYALMQNVQSRNKMMMALESLAKSHPNMGIRQGATNVIQAEYQRRLVAADAGEFPKILNEVKAHNIPPHKILKDFLVTTQSSISHSVSQRLQKWILLAELKQGLRPPLDILKQLCFAPNFDYKETMALLNGPEHEREREFLQLAEHMQSYFQSPNSAFRIEDFQKQAKNYKIDPAELFNLALDRYFAGGGAPNERTVIAEERANITARPLAYALYNALIRSDDGAVREIMEEVKRLGFAVNFHEFLKAVNVEASALQQNRERQAICDRIVEIYSAMGTLPFPEHHMSPYELVKCAKVAEEELRMRKEPNIIREEGTRTRFVNPGTQQVVFLNRSKGGTLYAFGSYKKVTSAIAVDQIWQGSISRFQVTPLSEAKLRKNEFLVAGSAQDFENEIQAYLDFRGLEGLVSFHTRVVYLTNAGSKSYRRQILLQKKYDKGGLFDHKNGSTPIEELICNFTWIAKGLKNLHHFKKSSKEKQAPRIHGDIKLSNMLVASDGSAALCDYGFMYCPSLNRHAPLFAPCYGTPGYSAPEVTIACFGHLDPKVKIDRYRAATLAQEPLDSFAVGISMIEMLTGITPPAMKEQMKFYDDFKRDEVKDPARAKKILSMHEQDYENAMKKFTPTSSTPNDRLQYIAWQMAHPDPTKRWSADKFLSEMQKLAQQFPFQR